MKKLASFFALTAILTLASCNKGDEGNTPTPTEPTQLQLLTDGIWDAESMRVQSKLNGVPMFDSTATLDARIQFLKNGKVVTWESGYQPDTTNYTLKNNVIHMDSVDYTITTLTKKQLVMKFNELYEDDPNWKVEVDYTVSCKK